MRKDWRGAAAVFAAVAVVFALVGCGQTASNGDGGGSAEPKGPITVGSKIDTEGELLATIIQQMLEANGFTVVDKSQTGTTEVVRTALTSGEIDIYPEYTGSGFWFYNDELTDEEKESFKDGEAGYQLVSRLDAEAGVVWLEPARANNTWAIAARKDFAEQNGLVTMSDFAEWVAAGNPTKVAASDEFFINKDANPAFEDVYGYSLTDSQQLRLAGGNTAATEKAVADGTDGVNFGMAYGTDGALADLGLVILEDDQGAQLVYWPTPTMSQAAYDRYPEIRTILAPVFNVLDLETLQGLNARIQVNGESAEAVAADFLASGGFVD